MSNHTEIAPIARHEAFDGHLSLLGAEGQMASAAFNTDHAAAKASGTSGVKETSLPSAAVHNDHISFGADTHNTNHGASDSGQGEKAAKSQDDRFGSKNTGGNVQVAENVKWYDNQGNMHYGYTVGEGEVRED